MLQGNTLKLVEHTVTNVTNGFSFLLETNCSQALVWQHVLSIRSFFHVKNVILDWVDDVCSFASYQSPQNLGWKRRLNIFLGERESPPCWKRIRVSDDLIYDNQVMHTYAVVINFMKLCVTEVINLTSVDLNSILFALECGPWFSEKENSLTSSRYLWHSPNLYNQRNCSCLSNMLLGA